MVARGKGATCVRHIPLWFSATDQTPCVCVDGVSSGGGQDLEGWFCHHNTALITSTVFISVGFRGLVVAE